MLPDGTLRKSAAYKIHQSCFLGLQRLRWPRARLVDLVAVSDSLRTLLAPLASLGFEAKKSSLAKMNQKAESQPKKTLVLGQIVQGWPSAHGRYQQAASTCGTRRLASHAAGSNDGQIKGGGVQTGRSFLAGIQG